MRPRCGRVRRSFRKLHESPGLRLRRGAIARSGRVADFDWRSVMDPLEHFYDQLITHRAECAGSVAVEEHTTL